MQSTSISALKNTPLKKAITILTAVFMLTSFLLLASTPTASALDRPTYAFLSVAPSPIGVGQTATVVMWLDTLPPLYANGTETAWHNFMVNITKPNGQVEKQGPFTSDAVSSAYFAYTPTEVGNYTFIFSFPGEDQIDGAHYTGSTSPPVTLVVQEEQIPGWPASPLPTEYWARPIYGTNREWSQIGGNWLGVTLLFGTGASSYGAFNPFTTAPESAHIVWNKPIQFGGIVGGNLSGIDASYYTGLSYEGRWSPPVIISGTLFFNLPNGNSGTGGGAVAVDLRTGQQKWWQNITISLGQVFEYDSPNQHGAYAYLWQTGSTYRMFDAFTGNLLLTLANASTGRITMDDQGDILVYMLNTRYGWFAMWNSSYASYLYPGTTGTNAWQWRPPLGTTQDWTKGIQWNVTIPKVSLMSATATLSACTIGQGVLVAAGQADNTTITVGGYDLTDGHQMWLINITSNAAVRPTYFIVPNSDGKFYFFKQETMQFYAYDIKTGALVWGPTEPYTNAFGMYTSSTNGLGASNPLSAYGILYSVAYDGKLHAYSTATGQHLWDFSTGDAGFETPYGTFPLGSGIFSIADGKVYVCTGEHSPNSPMWRGGRIFCVNATTGEGIWNLTGWWQTPVIADGYLASFNNYDTQVYSIGKGQTSTTVEAPLTPVTAGSQMVIQGTVLDQSPGAPGTPAISDKDMTQWMEYLYMQQPKPTNAIGVPVSIDAIDPNNNYVHLGDTVSDSSGHYGFAWQTPNVPGQYKIIASFKGSKSYFSSSAETTTIVSEQVPTATPVSPPAQEPTGMYILGLGAAIIIAIAIVGAVLLLAIRKRP
ncbi:MAG: PQQ-binding-like beta-propeller repeat protein [Candidatus Bathyarchaeota archaeon]|nr:PQQ-binding-like beta-propeller repeat protein [Candidatus Bathyarchaeota archaeon]